MTALPSAPALRPIDAILDLARWAPSGDNTQPWRFEVVDDSHVIVHGFDTRSHCVYDLDGHPSQMAIGAMLETAAIAASAHGLQTNITRRPGLQETELRFDVRFSPGTRSMVDPLIRSIKTRSVQRRAMSMRGLTDAEKSALERAAGTSHRIVWLDGVRSRARAALLLFRNAGLRLTLPEAYATHRDVIEWNARFSEDRVPDRALGVDPFTARLMRWVMGSWRRVHFFNRFLAGTWAPRLQMDLVPALACGAHFLIVARTPAHSVDDYVAAGRVMQRVWLTATSLGLGMQPEMTPLIFCRYTRNGLTFSGLPTMHDRARRLATNLSDLVGIDNASAATFMGRIGAGPAPTARSIRKPLRNLFVSN